MEVHPEYCATRISLEQRRLRLVSRLSALTSALTGLIGKNHATFLTSIAACQRTRVELVGIRRQIRVHRIEHRC